MSVLCDHKLEEFKVQTKLGGSYLYIYEANDVRQSKLTVVVTRHILSKGRIQDALNKTMKGLNTVANGDFSPEGQKVKDTNNKIALIR